MTDKNRGYTMSVPRRPTSSPTATMKKKGGKISRTVRKKVVKMAVRTTSALGHFNYQKRIEAGKDNTTIATEEPTMDNDEMSSDPKKMKPRSSVHTTPPSSPDAFTTTVTETMESSTPNKKKKKKPTPPLFAVTKTVSRNARKLVKQSSTKSTADLTSSSNTVPAVHTSLTVCQKEDEDSQPQEKEDEDSQPQEKEDEDSQPQKEKEAEKRGFSHENISPPSVTDKYKTDGIEEKKNEKIEKMFIPDLMTLDTDDSGDTMQFLMDEEVKPEVQTRVLDDCYRSDDYEDKKGGEKGSEEQCCFPLFKIFYVRRRNKLLDA